MEGLLDQVYRGYIDAKRVEWIMSSIRGGFPSLDVNSGHEWSDMDISDLKIASEDDWSLEEAADFLCRNRAEVKAKAKELGLALPQRAKEWAGKAN
jgi:hypothetical protein